MEQVQQKIIAVVSLLCSSSDFTYSPRKGKVSDVNADFVRSFTSPNHITGTDDSEVNDLNCCRSNRSLKTLTAKWSRYLFYSRRKATVWLRISYAHRYCHMMCLRDRSSNRSKVSGCWDPFIAFSKPPLPIAPNFLCQHTKQNSWDWSAETFAWHLICLLHFVATYSPFIHCYEGTNKAFAISSVIDNVPSLVWSLSEPVSFANQNLTYLCTHITLLVMRIN